MELDELLARLGQLPPEQQEALLKDANAILGEPLWVPNPGPQSDAYSSDAEEVFYGGQAGGGKSDLLLGLALVQHRRSLILRRISRDVLSLVDRCSEIVGTRAGYNGQTQVWCLTTTSSRPTWPRRAGS